MAMMINKNNIIMVSAVTTRFITISVNRENYSVDIDFDVPYDEICLNAWEQLKPKFTKQE